MRQDTRRIRLTRRGRRPASPRVTRLRIFYNISLSALITGIGLYLLAFPPAAAAAQYRTLGGVAVGYGCVRGYSFYLQWKRWRARQ